MLFLHGDVRRNVRYRENQLIRNHLVSYLNLDVMKTCNFFSDNTYDKIRGSYARIVKSVGLAVYINN